MNVHLCMLVKVLYLTDYFTFLMWCDNCASECAPVQVGHGAIFGIDFTVQCDVNVHR